MEYQWKVLIVDDENAFTDELRAVLEAQAYRVSVATDRLQAQQAARDEMPDAVLLGTIVPRRDAFLFYQWLKRTAPLGEVPIVVVDAEPPERHAKYWRWRKSEGLTLEAYEYLVKPVSPKALVPVFDKLMDRETRRIKVLVADDHAIIREGIRALLGVQKDIQVVGEAINGKDALDKARQLLPDVVLMDIVMPGMNGLEATKLISKECERTKVLMLTQYDDQENALASAQAGARGFIPKTSASTELLSAIRSLR